MNVLEKLKEYNVKPKATFSRDELIWIWKQADKCGINRFDAVQSVKYCMEELREFKSVHHAYHIWSVEHYV